MDSKNYFSHLNKKTLPRFRWQGLRVMFKYHLRDQSSSSSSSLSSSSSSSSSSSPPSASNDFSILSSMISLFAGSFGSNAFPLASTNQPAGSIFIATEGEPLVSLISRGGFRSISISKSVSVLNIKASPLYDPLITMEYPSSSPSLMKSGSLIVFASSSCSISISNWS